nr:MAG TPA: hypothetical protein [Caudoviricetes sp.]
MRLKKIKSREPAQQGFSLVKLFESLPQTRLCLGEE